MTNGRWAALAVALAVSTAFAAEEPERPWARGVAKDKQNQAIALFREGNSALKESLFPKAAGTYREALAYWDHPAIHYNLALALVNLDQPIEVHEHLTAALKFGAAPLDDDKYQQAQRYLALIERQLTKLTVKCNFDGAIVKLDGRTIFTGPGKWDGLVRSGQHSLSASKEGLLPDERSVTFGGGDSQAVEMRVYRTEELTEYKRAFSPVIPWAVLGAGIAAAGAGVGMHLGANGMFQQYDRGVTDCAGTTANASCMLTPALQEQRSSAAGLQTGAMAMYAVGGAAVVTSIVLFYAGRPIGYRKTVNVDASSPTPPVTLIPILTPNGAGAMASLEF